MSLKTHLNLVLDLHINVLTYIYPEIVIFMLFLSFFVFHIFKFKEEFFKIRSAIIYEFRDREILNFDLIKEAVLGLVLKNNSVKMKKCLSLTFSSLIEIIYLYREESKKVFTSQKKYQIYERNTYFYLGIGCFFGMFLYLYQFCIMFDYDWYITVLSFRDTFMYDFFSVYWKVFILGASGFFFFLCYIVFESWKYKGFEFGFFLVLFVFSMLLIPSCYDFFFLFLVVELQTLSLILLSAFQQVNRRSIEAALKYYILGAYFSGLFLFIMCIMYFIFGSLDFDSISRLCETGTFGVQWMDNFFKICMVIMIAFFIFKLGLFPFYYWGPDFYQGSHLLVVGFLVFISKTGLLAVFIRLFISLLGAFWDSWEVIITISSVGGIFVGLVGMFINTDLRRFLAYTSILNVSYSLLTLSIGGSTAIVNGLLYFITYNFATFIFCLILFGIGYTETQVEKGVVVETDLRFLRNIDDFYGIFRNNKLLAVIFLVVVASMMGFPPSTLFTVKAVLFECFSGYGYMIDYIIVSVTSILSSAVYLRIIVAIFLARQNDNRNFKVVSKWIYFLVAIGIFFCYSIFFVPGLPTEFIINITYLIFKSIR